MPTISGLTAQNRASFRAISQRISEIRTTLQNMYLSADQSELRDPMNGLEEAMDSLSGLWEEEMPHVPHSDEVIEIDDSALPF